MFKPGDRVKAEYWDHTSVGTVTCVSVTKRTYLYSVKEVVTYDVLYDGDHHPTRDVHADILSAA
mgnify:CR=1 FL=1